MPCRYLSEEPLRVAAPLRGLPLASPSRRAFALVFDFALLIVPSIAVAVSVALFALRLEDPAAFHALRTVFRPDRAHPEAHAQALGALAPLLVRTQAEGLPIGVEIAVERGDRTKAAEQLATYNLDFTLASSDEPEAALPPRTIRVHLERLIPVGLRELTAYGVMGLYFALATAGRRGQTLGKRLFGIRVVRLDGQRLSRLESAERFVGYLHIPGSLGLSLLDLWREPNRRMAHDRVAHTAVVRNADRAPRVEAASQGTSSSSAHAGQSPDPSPASRSANQAAGE